MRRIHHSFLLSGLGVTLAVGLVAVSTVAFSPSMSATEAEVRETVDLYFKGAVTGEASYFEEAFDLENGDLKSVWGNDADGYAIRTIPIRDAIAGWTRSPDPESEGQILDVKMVDDKLAHVTLEIFYKGRDYVDVLALYKVGDDWKIVNKTYVSHGRRNP